MKDTRARDRVSRLCEYAMRENVLPDLREYARYCEPGYDDPEGLILSADWNDRDSYDAATRTRVVTDNRPRRIGDLLERLGCELEWCDEWTACEECNGAIRTQPDSMSWTPSYVWEDECTIVCTECAEGGAL